MNGTDRTRTRSLATKIGAIGAALLALAIAAIGMTLGLTWQLEGGAAAVNEAGRMRMQTWQVAQALTGPVDRAAVSAGIDRLDASLGLLATGDPARPLALPGDADSRAAFDRVGQHWRHLREHWAGLPALDGRSAAPPEAEAAAFVATIDTLVDAIERQLARWTTRLNLAQFLMLALAIGAAATLLYSGQRLVFAPLARLRGGLTAIEAGDLTVRVATAPEDEFGSVAASFNRMARRLQALYDDLEQRVARKTVGLEAERARLAALYDAAAFVTRVRSLDALSRGFATRARAAARADAAAVRWSDEQNRRYILLAADGLPTEMVEAEHCVVTGDCFCGQPRAQAGTRVFPLIPVAADGDDRPRHGVDPGLCRRAGFVDVVSVPVRLHERLVGEIDLFYRHGSRLAADDLALLDAMASHLAGAIEGLRADALQREAAVAEERGLLARELHDSIAQGLAFLKIQSNLLRDEIERDRGDRVERALGELDEGIRESLSDVRELLVHFRTRTNAEDIAPALRTTLTKFEHQTGLPTELTIDGDGLALAPDVQIQVLHIVLEALSNVRKHARASRVRIEVRQSPRWTVAVDDDGCGFDDSRWQSDPTHVGLQIMGERAASIGATLAVRSTPGGGTRVMLALPDRRATTRAETTIGTASR